MITLPRLAGLSLFILVGYHYVNRPLGLTGAGSVALLLFGGCLMAVYPGYRPDGRNWAGWALIAVACLTLSGCRSFTSWLALPATAFVLGFRLAELPFAFPRAGDGGGYDGGAGGDLFDSDGGDAGAGGD